MKIFTLVARVASVSAMVILAILTGCNGGSKSDDQPRTSARAPLQFTDPLIKNADTIDAARLLTQASFGVSHASMIDIMQHASLDLWIDEQMALPVTLQLPDVEAYGNGSFRAPRHYNCDSESPSHCRRFSLYRISTTP